MNLGAEYPEIEDSVGKSELHIIDIHEEKDDITCDETEENDNSRELDKSEVEAIFVREKIQELINSNKKIKCKDGGGYRNIQYRDIVILLRSTSNLAQIFEKELVKNNIPVFSDSSSEYLETIEVQTVINLLKILDNPINDIILVSVMRSPMFGFTDNEILEIRLENREDSVYSNLYEYRLKGNELSRKSK